jgi:AcrR family transcriptional regulator
MGTLRRDAILSSALELFRERGFHAVGIDEIGTAAGISGPAVYRHFPSKNSLLVALFDHISERMLDGAQKIGAEGLAPGPTLDRLVALHVSFAVDERSLLAVWIQDWRSLLDPDAHRIRRRQVQYMSEWTLALGRLRPDFSPEQLDTIAYAAVGAINSVAFRESELSREALDPLLCQLARAVLRGSPPEVEGNTHGATSSGTAEDPEQGVYEPDA